jgi:centrosomal protein CEP41
VRQQKNHESKLIILYDMDEKTVTQTAHTLVQRGFDNIYVLTGGMADYAEEFPDHIEGIPLPRRPGDPSKKAAAASTREVYKTAPSLTSTSSVAKSVKSAATRRKDAGSDVSSVMSSLSVAETVISKANARKARISGGGAANYR